MEHECPRIKAFKKRSKYQDTEIRDGVMTIQQPGGIGPGDDSFPQSAVNAANYQSPVTIRITFCPFCGKRVTRPKRRKK